MKKVLLLVTCLACGGCSLFARDALGLPHEAAPQHAVGIDFGPLISGLVTGGLGLGASYETALTSTLAIKISGHYSSKSTAATVSGSAAWDAFVSLPIYLDGQAIDGFYLEPGVGLNSITTLTNGTSLTTYYAVLETDIGYKFNLGGFFLQPSFGPGLILFSLSGGSFAPALTVHFGATLGIAF